MSMFHVGHLVQTKGGAKKGAQIVLPYAIPMPSDIPETMWRPVIWGSKASIFEHAERLAAHAEGGARELMVSLAAFDSGSHFGNRCRVDDLPHTRVLYVDRLVNETILHITDGLQLPDDKQDGRQTIASMRRIALMRNWNYVISLIENSVAQNLAHIRAIAITVDDKITADEEWLSRYRGLRLAMISRSWKPDKADPHF